METVRIYRLDNLPPSVSRRLYDAQLETARLWNLCRDIHNQRMSQWEYGKHIDYLRYKCKQGRIMCFTGTERGTSS